MGPGWGLCGAPYVLPPMGRLLWGPLVMGCLWGLLWDVCGLLLWDVTILGCQYYGLSVLWDVTILGLQSWRGCPVRLFTVALLEDNSVALRRLLESFARRLRLPASTEVVELVRERD